MCQGQIESLVNGEELVLGISVLIRVESLSELALQYITESPDYCTPLGKGFEGSIDF